MKDPAIEEKLVYVERLGDYPPTSGVDPASALQVRWDWENDGIWDTDWSTDKTEENQYAEENFYTVKMEVMDTEELSDFATHNVSVNNGGGGGEPCPGIPTITYEGQVYNTVLIGNQCWFKENLNVSTMINGADDMQNTGTIEKYCYNDEPSNCAIYGGLYQWNEMMQYVTTPGTQGICPSGWHIPTDDEFKILEDTVDSQYGVGDPVWDDSGYRGFDAGFYLKSTTLWNNNGNGDDAYGFTALPGGNRNNGDSFNNLSNNANFWSSTENSGSNAWNRNLNYNNDKVNRNNNNKTNGVAARCLQDY